MKLFIENLFCWILVASLPCLSSAKDAKPEVENSQPVWELGKSEIKPDDMVGKLDVVDGSVLFDGTNSFSIPASLLANRKDFTIEFEVKRPSNVQSSDKIALVSNTDEAKKTGFGLRYFPPSYNAFWLMVNGHRTVEYRGFLTDKSSKITMVAKDGQMMLFRDKLLLASTEAVSPSSQPLIFGRAETELSSLYEVKNLKIYDQAIYPVDLDPNAKRMRYFGGDGFSMQRVELENPDLPRILVIGDSISGGYRSFITEHFEGKANVDYWMVGYLYAGGEDSPLNRALAGVLSNGPYDIVTFNFGLHWWPKEERYQSDVKYIEEMTTVVDQMKKATPETEFLWMRTTPWRTTPTDSTPTLETEENKRIIHINQLADKIMNDREITIVDLYTIASEKLNTIKLGSQDSVHWPREVSKLFADKIIETISSKL